MTARVIKPAAIAAPVGLYSHGIAAPGSGTWLHVSGQIGLLPDGTLAVGFEPQAHAAWSNLVAILSEGGMGVEHLVKLTTYLVDAAHLPLLNGVRSGYLQSARPASTLVVVQALARPDWLFEVEAVAWRA